MRAILIQPDTRSIDAVGNAGDHLFFDEECFLRGTDGRFQIDKLIPASGVGVIVCLDGDILCDAATDLDDLRRRIRYL